MLTHTDLDNIARLAFGVDSPELKVVLENMLRFEDDKIVTVDDIKAFAEWSAKGGENLREIA